MDAAAALRMIVVAIAVFVVSLLAGVLLARSGSNTVEAQVTGGTTTTTTLSSITSTTVLSVEPEALAQTTTTALAPVRDFADLFEEVRGAVAQVDVVRCASSAQGTAFLVDTSTAYTAWHLVQNAAEIALDFGEQRVEASVIGHDRDRDVAVLRLAVPIEDAVTVTIADSQVRVGEQVAALGHPGGAPLSMAVGRVTSVDGVVQAGDPARQVSAVVQTEFGASVGSSGGPLINGRGELVGITLVASQGPESPVSVGGFAADIDGARSELVDLGRNPEPVRPAFCIGEIDLNDIDDVAPQLIRSEVDAPQVPSLQRTFAVFSQSINSDRADQAFALLGPAETADTTAEAWARGQQTSKLWDWNIRSIEPSDTGLAVRSTFTSTQAAEDGFDGQSECTRWDLIYDMVLGEFQGREFWLINGSRPGPGGPAVDCADWQPTRVQRGRLDAPAAGETIEVADFLAAGTIDAWTLQVSAPGDVPQMYRISLASIDGGERLGITLANVGGAPVVGPGSDGAVELGRAAQLTFERQGRVDIEVGELLEEFGGEYRLIIENVTDPALVNEGVDEGGGAGDDGQTEDGTDTGTGQDEG